MLANPSLRFLDEDLLLVQARCTNWTETCPAPERNEPWKGRGCRNDVIDTMWLPSKFCLESIMYAPCMSHHVAHEVGGIEIKKRNENHAKQEREERKKQNAKSKPQKNKEQNACRFRVSILFNAMHCIQSLINL